MSDYDAQDKLHTVLVDAFKDAKKTEVKAAVPKICFKSLLALTVFVMLVSGVTSLAIVSMYCTLFMR